jgi:hypothetical protein
MNFKTIILSVILLIVLSCSQKKQEIPSGIISADTMIHLLTEMHLAQASIAVNALADSSRYNMAEYQQFILSRYGISKPDFIKSISYYSANPDVLKVIYDSVLIDLTRIQAETK